MSRENVELAQRAFDAFNRRDPAYILDLRAPEHPKRWCGALVETRRVLLALSEQLTAEVGGEHG